MNRYAQPMRIHHRHFSNILLISPLLSIDHKLCKQGGVLSIERIGLVEPAELVAAVTLPEMEEYQCWVIQNSRLHNHYWGFSRRFSTFLT